MVSLLANITTIVSKTTFHVSLTNSFTLSIGVVFFVGISISTFFVDHFVSVMSLAYCQQSIDRVRNARTIVVAAYFPSILATKKVSPHLKCDGHKWRHRMNWILKFTSATWLTFHRIYFIFMINALILNFRLYNKNELKLQIQMYFDWPTFL